MHGSCTSMSYEYISRNDFGVQINWSTVNFFEQKHKFKCFGSHKTLPVDSWFHWEAQSSLLFISFFIALFSPFLFSPYSFINKYPWPRYLLSLFILEDPFLPPFVANSYKSKMSSKRVTFSPDANEKPTVFLKHGGSARAAWNRKRVIVGIFSFRIPRDSGFSPARLLRHLGAKVTRALRFVSTKKRSSRKVTSSTLARSRSLAESIESHRAEAIEDCIEFLNSSSSMSRSNSVSAGSC